MKVAALAHSFPRFPGDTHGPFVKRLCESLAARGHEIVVLVPDDPEIGEDPDTPLAIRSFRYAWPRRWQLLGYSRTLRRDMGMKLSSTLQSPLYLHFADRALRRLVRRQGIDLIHAHWVLPNGWVAARVAQATGVPYAVSLHGSDVFMAERNPLFRHMARRALAGATHVTSCSGELAERLLAVGGEEHADKVVLVPYGTDLDPAGAEAAVAPDPAWLGHGTAGVPAAGDPAAGVPARLVVAVGRLVDKKGFRYLLEATPRIVERFPGARVVIGGGGDLEATLRRQARDLGIAEAVVFTGHLSHQQVLGLIAAAEVFVMPSVRDAEGNIDGLPNVILEAMAAARPVVASDITGIPLAVVEGVTGRLVPAEDGEALAAAVCDLLAAPEEARGLGEAGRRKVRQELTWEAVAAVHDGLYERFVG